MPDNDGGTAAPEGEAQLPAGTPPLADEVTTLRSRNAGLDAKVTSLTQSAKDAIARAEAAEARAIALAEGKENGDAELRAQLEAERAETAKLKLDNKLARIEARYPETYGVLGAAASGLTDDQLAASEARMSGGGSAEPPVPLGSNPPRPLAPVNKAIEDMNSAELEKYLKAFDPAVMFNSQRD